jgi:hypothetical protein
LSKLAALIDPALYVPTPFNSVSRADALQVDPGAFDHELRNEEGVLDGKDEDSRFIKYFIQIQNVLYKLLQILQNERRLGILKPRCEYRVVNPTALLES